MYQKVTQWAEGQLLAWYGMPDHTWNVEMDFDVLQDYAVYPYEWIASWLWTFVAEHLPTKNCFWAYHSVEEACKAVLNKINEKQEATKKIEEAGAKFQEVVKANSLDERYKDKVVTPKKKEVKTTWYLENLMKKARERTEEMHAMIAEWRMQRNWKLANEEYVEALLNH